MIMINSTILESDSDKNLCFSNLQTNENNLLINSITEKFDDINNNHYQKEKSLFDCNNIIKKDILLSNNHENDTTLLTTTTTTTTVEVKVKTTKTSSRKRKLNIINDINNDNINKQQVNTKKKKKQRVTKIDNDNKTKKTNSKTVDQSSVTDESSFGSCEPGTSVVLQGIVWNETDKGVLVVNITWRGKTYVGALLNTTEQNWAPPRYKSDVRSIKQNSNRDHQLPSISSSSSSSHESTERILRNGKRRGSSTTVTPSSTTKTKSFKIPETPSTSKNDEPSTIIEKLVRPLSTNIHDEDETNIRNTNGGGDDETGDNYSSRSVSPTTSGISTTSSSPPLSNHIENQSTSIPIDLSNSKPTMNIEQSSKSNTKETLIPYHFTNDMLFSSSTNSSDYFSSLNQSTNSFNLPSFQKLSSTSSTISPSSYLPIPSQLYFNSLTTSPHYPSISSLSKSSR